MKSLRLPSLVLGAVALLASAGPASALGTHVYNVTMNSAQEVPPNGSTGTGPCIVSLDDVTGQVTVTGSYSGLTSNATAAHIHGPAGPGVNAGIVIGLTPTGGTSGTISGGGTLSAANVTNMLNGLTYLNIHTTSFPGGELRAQIVGPVSVPALPWAWMAVLGAAALAGGAFVLTRRGALA